MKKIIFFLVFIFPSFCIACPQFSDAEDVLENIAQKEYLQCLIEDRINLTYVLYQVQSGDKDWLNVAHILRSESDAAMTQLLIYSVSFALKNSPSNVLEILGEAFSVYDVCGSPFIEENLHYELGFLEALREGVMKSNYIGENKKECLSNIELQISLANQHLK